MMFNTRKIQPFLAIFIGTSLFLSFSAQASTANLNQIAQNCRPYLLTYSNTNPMPEKVANIAAPVLSQCVTNASCTNSALSDIPNCALKLSNLSMNASLASVDTSAPDQTAPESSYQAQPSVQPYIPPVTTRQPEKQETQETQQTPQQAPQEKQQQQKKQQPQINWF